MSEGKSKLTAAQRSRMERNRVKAEHLRQAKLISHPYATNGSKLTGESAVIKMQGTRYVDSGGGFLVEQPMLPGTSIKSSTGDAEQTTVRCVDDALAIPVQYEECMDCGDTFVDSFLFDNFGYSVCDKCRDPDERHSLITRSEAKAEYLLKDCDFDKRDPPLRYISRKNPHNVRWGEMKLYLHLQVEQRAMEVWESADKLMQQHEKREEQREVTKLRKYNKQMKQLRMEVRSSLYTKETKGAHQHEFGPEKYNEDEDNYTHKCLICSYEETYEKM